MLGVLLAGSRSLNPRLEEVLAVTTPFVVQQSFPMPKHTTNPYLVMLERSLSGTPGVEVRTFTWKRALLRRYDVFHAHWPEILVSGHSPLKKLVRQVLFAALLAKLRLTRTPIVRTVHNLRLPQGISRLEVMLLSIAERQTTLRIVINTSTHLPAGQPSVTILHGHYRDWFAQYELPPAERGRLTYIGLIRRYKGVDRLISAFRQFGDASSVLDVAGRPSSPELESELLGLADGDDRVSLRFAFLNDAELVSHVGRAELVVLPYREMHNSGGALTTLSLGRPVLMPDNLVNRQLAAEVGIGWVFGYSGELEADDIAATLESLRTHPPSAVPDLSARDWYRTGLDHLTAYRQAVDILRNGATAPTR